MLLARGGRRVQVFERASGIDTAPRTLIVTSRMADVLGELGELFVNKERFDVFVCGRCGRVELFIDGIGEQFRPH